MKICPRCQKTYSDDSLNFCLDDGATLNAATADQLPATVVMNQPPTTNPPASFGGQTANQPNWNTNQTPNQFSMQPPAKKSKGWLWALGILGAVALICGGGFVGFIFWAASLDDANKNQNRYNSNRIYGNNSSSSPRNSTPANKGTEKIDLSLWTRTDPTSGTTEFINDELLMSSAKKGYYYVICAKANTYQTENATTRLTVRNVDGEKTSLGFGLVFHSNPVPLVQDYAFLIDSENKRYRVVRHKPGNEISVVSWTRFASIKDGDEKNVLEVRDENKKMSFYINGDFVKTIDNEEGYSGGVAGIYAGDAAKIAFSDFEITK